MELKTKQKAAFGFGAFGKDVVYMLIASYLLYYYNVVLGMNSVFIGTVMMAARIFDAFNDPFMGIVVAKTKTKWGKFRPWILAGTVLNAVTIYALYATPASMGESAQRVWLTVFYFAWGITYTLMDIPFWSMIPAITEPGKDREQLTALARTCSGIGDAIPTVLTMTLVPILSASTVVADYRIGFKWWALIIAVVFVISEVVCVVSVPEKPMDHDMKTTKVGEMFKSLFKNDQAMTVVVSIILVYTALNICGNLVLYFFRFDVGNEGAYSVFAAVAFAAQVLAMMIIPWLRKKFSKAQLFMSGFIIQIAGFLVILFMAYTQLYTPENWQILCIPGILIYVGYGMLNVIMTIFLSDSVDYGEVKNGTRDESVIFSMQTFTVKLASGIAVFIAGLVVDWICLDTEAEIQSASTLQGLRMWMTIPSILLLIGGIIVFKKCYILNDRKMEEIKRLEKYEFRSIRPEEAEQAASIEQICFPPNEACLEQHMKERVAKAPELFLVAADKSTGRLVGFLNGLATDEYTFRDEFFTDANLYDPDGKNIMLLGLDVLPEYRGQGIAKELVYSYARREWENGRHLLILTCLKPKVKMYEKMGFIDRGIANSTWGGEEWHDMAKSL